MWALGQAIRLGDRRLNSKSEHRIEILLRFLHIRNHLYIFLEYCAHREACFLPHLLVDTYPWNRGKKLSVIVCDDVSGVDTFASAVAAFLGVVND